MPRASLNKLILLCMAVYAGPLAAQVKTLHEAAKSGDALLVKQLAGGGADINAADPKTGWTPLIVALLNNRTGVVRALLDSGADSNRISEKEHRSPVAFAAEYDEVESVKLLVAKHADLNAAEPPNFTPLAYASWKGHLDMVKLLLESRNVNGVNRADVTALMAATEGGNIEILKFLLSKGADIHASNEIGLSALYNAAFEGQVEATKLLLDRGLSAAETNGDRSVVGFAAERNHPELVLLLLDRGAPINADLNFEESLLSYACGHGDAALMKELIRRGAKYDVSDAGISRAAMRGHAECIQLLVSTGVKFTPLYQTKLLDQAVAKGQFDAAMVLLRAIRKWNEVPESDKTRLADQLLAAAYHDDAAGVRTALAGGIDDKIILVAAKAFAEQQGNIDALHELRNPTEKLVKADAKTQELNEELVDACQKGNFEKARGLIARGANADYRNLESGFGALYWAAGTDNLDLVRFLIDRGAKLNTRSGYGMATPLGGAALAGRSEVVKLLLERGADPNLVRSSFTPLAGAACGGHLTVLQLLLDAHVEMNAATSMYKRTALMWAADGGKADVVKLLLERGADASLKDVNGATALDIARSKQNDAVASALSAGGAPAGVARGAARVTFVNALTHGADGVKRWLDEGGNPNEMTDVFRQPPLRYLMESPGMNDATRYDVAELLLTRGANPNDGALIVAISQKRSSKFVKLLLDHRANPNDDSLYADKTTPLLAAAQHGDGQIAQMLLTAGAQLAARNLDGEDAFALAKKAGNTDVLEVLNRSKRSSPASTRGSRVPK